MKRRHRSWKKEVVIVIFEIYSSLLLKLLLLLVLQNSIRTIEMASVNIAAGDVLYDSKI